MTSPFPLDIAVELFHDSVWNDITADVRQTADIKHKWGRGNETSEVPPRSLELTLNNGISNVNPSVSGRYSPRNPRSDLHKKIGRNTPIRVRLGERRNEALALLGSEDVFVSTPDDAALDITGDIDVRIEVEPETWRPALATALARKYVTTDDERSWGWWVEPEGTPRFRWSPDGTITNAITVEATEPVPVDSGRLAVRVTVDVDNGASGNDAKFFTATSIAGPWTQLGATVTTSGITSILASTSDLELGRTNPAGINTEPFEGLLYAFELRNGIDGILVAAPDFSGHEPMDTSFTDSAGLTWTVNGTGAHFPDPSIRYGEVTKWPVQWDRSGNNVFVSITAKGILQRMGQGQSPLRSSMFRDLSTKANVVAYWPLEDGADATRFASGLAGDTSTLTTGADADEVTLADFDGFVASEPIPTIEEGLIHGNTPEYDGADSQRLFFLCAVPEGGVAGDRVLMLTRTSGTISRWDIVIEPTGGMKVRGFDSDLNLVFDSGFAQFFMNGQLTVVSLQLEQNGADVTWALFKIRVGDTVGGSISGIETSVYDRFRTVQVGTTPGSAGTAYGHITILNDDIHSIWDTIGSSLVAWTGETAAERVMRLCEEEGIPLQSVGRPLRSKLMGHQPIATLLELLREAADTDLAILGDAVDAGALRWRGRADLYNQDAALTLDYEAGEVSDALDPVEDDQAIRNDVTVKRKGGSSARAVQETGQLNVQLPEDDPQGVGRYDTKVDLSLHGDGQPRDQSAWRKHLGTVDEARYPRIGVNLGATPTLSDAATAVESGDRIQVTNPPDWLPAATIDQFAQGGTETLGPFNHKISYTCTPASPWTVGEVSDGTDEQRADTEDSTTTASFVSGTDTSLSVATNRGPLWTTDAGQFPFEIKVSGVVLNVTAITGITSPQTFTVDATPVNGVAKTILSGEDVRLAQPAIVAL